MQLHQKYKHINSLGDVAFIPLDITHDGEVCHIEGLWYNLNYRFVIDKDLVTIKKEDMENWRMCNE